MVCPSCNAEVSVLETISQQKIIWRQRKCNGCGNKFYTKEILCSADEAKPLFDEWTRERSRKCRAKKRGLDYEPTFADGREKSITPKKPTSPLF